MLFKKFYVDYIAHKLKLYSHVDGHICGHLISLTDKNLVLQFNSLNIKQRDDSGSYFINRDTNEEYIDIKTLNSYWDNILKKCSICAIKGCDIPFTYPEKKYITSKITHAYRKNRCFFIMGFDVVYFYTISDDCASYYHEKTSNFDMINKLYKECYEH